jgi:5-methylcytosine-specific restriction enzyme A
MPLLYYWRGDNYRRDLDMGAGYHLNQANPLMHKIDIGDSLWAFTRNLQGKYVLASHLIVKAKTINPSNFRYGHYRIWGDLTKSRYFKTEEQPGIEQIIRNLSCTTNASILGHSFQGLSAVKLITHEDNNILLKISEELPIEPRAYIFPEERLEAMLLLDNPEEIQTFLQQEPLGIAKERYNYLHEKAPKRNKKFVQELQKLYQGQCQICKWNPVNKYAEYLCHGHHIHWLSRGGQDSKDNLILVCPNHHGAIHRCDAVFDYNDFAFYFGNHSEKLQINLHLSQ